MSDRAIFAAGCFWGIEAAYRQIPGVIEAVSGYTGGHTEGPTYREVCSGRTGHAEAVEVTYDPEQVGFDTLLDAFWKMHDPTQKNRQGPDVGTQYRSAVFAVDPEQERVARESMEAESRSGRHARPIATEITPASTFYPAEEYHQRYFEKHGMTGCGIH